MFIKSSILCFFLVFTVSANGNEGGGGFPGFGFNPFDFGSNSLEPQASFQDFFKNLESAFHEQFLNNLKIQRAAMQAAQRAYQITIQNIQRQQQQANSGIGDRFNSNQDSYGAYAGGYAGPSGTGHYVGVNPTTAHSPNQHGTSGGRQGGPSGSNNFYSVSSSSFSNSKTDPDGKVINDRGGKTVINDNGNVKEYSSHS